MDDSQTTIHPPAKHADQQWHWTRHEGDDKWFVFEAKDGRMWNGPGHMGADYAYAVGWRYVGPAMPPTTGCEHEYTYLGLQWWDDGRLRRGSGATTIHYANTFFCRRCINKVFERTDITHSSYEKRLEGAVPASGQDWRVLQDGR